MASREGEVPVEGKACSGAAPAESPVSSAVLASSWTLVARLVRPHGRRGEIVADTLTDFPDRFHERPRLFLIPPPRIGAHPREIRVENFWFQRGRVIFKFRGIDSINDAETLRGFEVAIPAAERAPLDKESVYISDLIGCCVFDLSQGGAEAGEIIDVDRQSSSTELLVIRRPGLSGPEAEALVPFAREYLISMDTEHRRIEMRLPAGLLEINAPMTTEEKRQFNAPGGAETQEDEEG